MKKLILIVSMLTAPFAGFSQCSTTNATTCACPPGGGTNCDLLPDMIVGKPPLQTSGNYGIVEYSQSGNGSNNAKLRISVSTPNIGSGPLEVRASTTYICGTDTFIGTPPTICPDGITYPKNLVNQRVYHKNGNVMSYYDRPAGTMTYHPAHGHMHVDDWGIYTLRTATGNPDPLSWPIVATGAKLAFCLMDYGTCTYYSGHCVDSTGNTLNNNNFPNFGLGGGAFNCSPVIQGISTGYTDIYYQYLDGMWINLPAGLCNGSYYIVVQLDPYNYFLEQRENNNVVAIPYTLTKQSSQPIVGTTPNATICAGTSTTITASGATTYSWSPASGLNATTGTSVIASPSSTTTYTVTGTNASGCSKTKTVTVSINAKPNMTLTPSSAVCTGQSKPLQATGANTYTWAPATGLSATTGSTVQSTPASTTTYTVTGTASNGCTSTLTVTVTVNAYPVVNATANSSICSGTTINLSASGATTYGWAPSTGLNMTTGSAITAGPINTTTYTVTGTTNGCSSTKTIAITVNQNPGLSISASTIICSGQSAPLQVSGAVSYTWQPSSGLDASTGAAVNASPTNTTTYTVTGTGANGCTASAQTTVSVYSTPELYLSGDVSFCPGGTALIQASGADEYSWQPATGLDATTGDEVNAGPATTTIYTVTGSNGGCTDTKTVTVTVNAIPQVSISGLATSYFDNDSDVSLTGIPSGGIFTGTGINGNVFSPVGAGVGGPYMIMYTYTDSNGCTNDVLEPVEVIQHVIPCGTPTLYTAIDISPFSATVIWGPDVSALQFSIRYRKAGTVAYKYKTISGTPNVTSAFINNLLPNTTYECWVKSYCIGPHPYSNKITFTTGGYPYTCIIPFGQLATNITTSAAMLSWDPSASGDSVQVRYTNASGTPSYKYRKVKNNTSFVNISALKANTTYNWSVQLYCNGTTSGYSSTTSFTTAPARLSGEPETPEDKILAYPNPARDQVHVVFNSQEEGTGTLRITDLTGRLIYSRSLQITPGDNLVEVNLSNFNKGVYMLCVERNDKVKYVKLSVN